MLDHSFVAPGRFEDASTRPLSASASRALSSDSAVLQRRLARWNRARLAPGTPNAAWQEDLHAEFAMRRAEGQFIEDFRSDVAAEAMRAPSDAKSFVEWFADLKETGPGQNDPLFPWLAQEADLESMRWFLTQEVAGEAGFDDLVAYAQVKMPATAKLELARNYWDEMGQGEAGGMHGPMLSHLAATLELRPSIETTLVPALTLGNAMIAFSTNRRYAYHAIGALGVIELTAPGRAAFVDAGLRRLGVGRARRYFSVHATLDVRHSLSWNAEVIRPLVAADPRRARFIAEGALMRLTCGRACFDSYRAELWRATALR